MLVACTYVEYVCFSLDGLNFPVMTLRIALHIKYSSLATLSKAQERRNRG
jgi:hypothetical protein